MSWKSGMTLMEIIVVMIMVAVASVFLFPNFNDPTERAHAATTQNNLLAIYSAQQNYNNNFGSYCLSTSAAQPGCTGASANCGDSLAALNCNIGLSIQDDGSYAYACTGSTCTATRNANGNGTIVLTLNAPVNVSSTGTSNPLCNLTAKWCP